MTDIVEESLFQATRALSEDRMRHIANVVAIGLSESELNYEETKRMLWLLGQLNDSEIILLRGHLPVWNTDGQADEEFQTTHRELLRPWANPSRSREPSVEELRRTEIRKSHLNHLSQMKLIEKSEVTLLGRMLLRYLDLMPEWCKRIT